MRKLFTLFAAAIIIIAAGCSKAYDDSAVWDSLNSLEQRLSAMETVMKAYEKNLFIKKVDPIDNGYKITFSDGSIATIINGKDGEDGNPGTDGKPGEDGKDGDTYIKSITIGENEVTFVLTDGKTFSIPLYSTLSIAFDSEDLVVMQPNSTQDIHYTITSILSDIEIEVISSTDIKAKVVESSNSNKTGVIQVVTSGAIDEYSKVVVLVSNGEKVIMKRFSFEKEGLSVYDNTEVNVEANGGNIALVFMSNIPCVAIIEDNAKDWISFAPATTRIMEKQSLDFIVEKNTGELRKSKIVVKSTVSDLKITYVITQHQDIDAVLAQQKAALIELYNATAGNNWTTKTNWCSNTPIYQWYGLDFDDHGYVTKLRLPQNNLVAETFPIEELSKLANLEVIYWDGNRIRGELPGEIKNLSRLKELWLSGNQIKGPLPAELGSLSNLKRLDLGGNQITGTLPKEIGNLSNLEWLYLCGNQIEGQIPASIGSLLNLKELHLYNNLFSGNIPPEIGNLTNLTLLAIRDTPITGPIPAEIGQMTNLEELDLSCNQLNGSVPAEIGNLKKIEKINLTRNQLSGKIPTLVTQLPIWKTYWPAIVFKNNIDLSNTTIPAPRFNEQDLNGNYISSQSIYTANKFTILYRWECDTQYSLAYTSSLIALYGGYHEKGVEVVGYSPNDITDMHNKVAMTKMPWINFKIYTDALICPISFRPSEIDVVNAAGEIVFSSYFANDNNHADGLKNFLKEQLGDEDIPPVKYYESTDYTADGKVSTMQSHSNGNGIKLVFMGDGFVDTDFADGTFDIQMKKAMDIFFELEPYHSFRSYFDVYCVAAVSKNREFFPDAEPAFNENHLKVLEYAKKAIADEYMDNTAIVVILNTREDGGVTVTYSSESINDWGPGTTISYCCLGPSNDQYEYILQHEVGGHGFGKLADEYSYNENGAISISEVTKYKSWEAYGWNKNIDFTNDVKLVKWSRLFCDARYQKDYLGIFEGAATYWTGVYRPTVGSIMRNNFGIFNAPSREAIYYRIHKLAYGSEWQYDYEKFVEYDAINRTMETGVQFRAPMRLNTKDFKHNPPVIFNHTWRKARSK